MMNTLIFQHGFAILQKLREHINLSFVALFIAVIIGIPLGIYIVYYPRLRNSVLGLSSIFQTIPSLALLAFLIPIFGIGEKPAIIALTLYALLPIIRNAYTGIKGVNPALLQAADGLGFTRWQKLIKVELPLALPVIIAGIRTGAVMTIGIATIAALIGAGGLGDFITQGLALSNNQLILMGAIPAAILALVVDMIIGRIELWFSIRSRKKIRHQWLTIFLFVLIVLMIIMSLTRLFVLPHQKNSNTIVIASKNFTEQYILANMIAVMINAHTHLNIIKKFNLGTTAIIHEAMMNGDVDIYPEYTGTAYLTILNYQHILPAKQTYDLVKNAYQQQFQLTWFLPFGFNDSETLAVTNAFAAAHHLETLSDLVPLAPQLKIAAPAEFIKRSDGLPGLKKTYHFKFKAVLQIQPDLIYSAIKSGAVDIIQVFTTDGRIHIYQLKPLIDDLHFYPPYDAAIVMRTATLNAHPELASILKPLSGLIDNKTMEKLNYKVNVLKQTPGFVAHQFLLEKKLIQ